MAFTVLDVDFGLGVLVPFSWRFAWSHGLVHGGSGADLGGVLAFRGNVTVDASFGAWCSGISLRWHGGMILGFDISCRPYTNG
jgi:hypothetical protein